VGWEKETVCFGIQLDGFAAVAVPHKRVRETFSVKGMKASGFFDASPIKKLENESIFIQEEK
jgi:hypothetical protein